MRPFAEDIARLCGFINPAHFAVAFKRSANLSPSEYRKLHARKKDRIIKILFTDSVDSIFLPKTALA